MMRMGSFPLKSLETPARDGQGCWHCCSRLRACRCCYERLLADAARFTELWALAEGRNGTAKSKEIH